MMEAPANPERFNELSGHEIDRATPRGIGLREVALKVIETYQSLLRARHLGR